MQINDKTIANFNEHESVYEISQQTHSIEYCILLLTNVTQIEEGQKHLLGEGKTKGLILDNLFGMFCYFLKGGIFDFVSNILSNVAGLQEGRQHMLDNKMLPKIIELLVKNGESQVNEHRRTFLIETLRNISFEYEKNEALFAEGNVVKDIISILAQE